MKKAEKQKKIDDVFAQQEVDNVSSNLNRARSVTVGTAFGGTTEVMMRGNDGRVLWALLQPVEAIELIHQLAANVGCHLQLTPRRDFSSWRDWKYTDQELSHFRGNDSVKGVGHAPHPKAAVLPHTTGSNLPKPDKMPGRPIIAKEQQNETVAIEKTVNRRSTKRAAKAS